MSMGLKHIALTAPAPGSTRVSAFAQAQDVKIGFAVPLTGGQADDGADFRSGVTLAIEDFNATKR